MFLVDCTSTQNISKIMINNVRKKKRTYPCFTLFTHCYLLILKVSAHFAFISTYLGAKVSGDFLNFPSAPWLHSLPQSSLDDGVSAKTVFQRTVGKCLPKFIVSGGLVARWSKSGAASEVALQIPPDARRHAKTRKHHLL